VEFAKVISHYFALCCDTKHRMSLQKSLFLQERGFGENKVKKKNIYNNLNLIFSSQKRGNIAVLQ